MGNVYCTTFCNFGHDVDTGEPVDHECYDLDPEILKIEMDEGPEAALKAMAERDKGMRKR